MTRKEQTMSKDTIYREDAIGACAYETLECYEARKTIRALPSADRPQGEWVPFITNYYKCSLCGKEMNVYLMQEYNFCPNCGAHMAVKGADDD